MSPAPPGGIPATNTTPIRPSRSTSSIRWRTLRLAASDRDVLHPSSGDDALPSLGLDFFFLFKLPVWIADFVIAAVLARMSGTVRGFRDYLLNPYVLLISGAWTFDAVMVVGSVLSVYWMQREQVGRSALALAFGTMVKFIPAFVAPTLVLYMIKKQRPIHEIALFVGA